MKRIEEVFDNRSYGIHPRVNPKPILKGCNPPVLHQTLLQKKFERPPPVPVSRFGFEIQVPITHNSTVIDDFVSCAPRESSGARSANRFDYQLSWAFCLMLDLERKGREFLLILDYHDDVVVFDAETNPTAADFYQIKTSTSEKWTLTKLTSKTEGKLSILGKLYAHRINFKNKAKSLNFVSNQVFSLPIVNMKTLKDLESAKISDVCAEALRKVANSLKQEHDLSDILTVDIDFNFTTNGMTPKSHEKTAQGELSQYLNDIYGNRPYFVSNAFRAIIDLVKRRNNFEGIISNAAELIEKKAVSKSEFSSLVARSARLGDDATWIRLENMFLSEGLGIGKIRKYQTLWRNREIELLEYSNFIIQQSQQIAEAVAQETIEQHEDEGICTILEICCDELEKRLSTSTVPFSRDHLVGAVLTSFVNFFQ